MRSPLQSHQYTSVLQFYVKLQISTAMILAHAQFVLRNMETVGRGPDSAIASGSASATEVSLAVAPPSWMT